jgi:hypothetical protein
MLWSVTGVTTAEEDPRLLRLPLFPIELVSSSYLSHYKS